VTWLPRGKAAAVCLSVDDVHPAPVAREALSHLGWLQERHPGLRATLFTTPDWRTREPYPTRPLLARVPLVRDLVFLVPVHPRGTFRLDRHGDFCDLLRAWPGVEVGLHGLQHVRRGTRPVAEFADRGAASCARVLREALALFAAARLPVAPGMSPPGWEAPRPLLDAMRRVGLAFVASARDLHTTPAADAVARGSGLTGVSLIRPERLPNGLLHFPTNVQATSTVERALAIAACGGLVSVKAHLLARAGSYRALDGLTVEYREHLHRVLSALENRFGDSLWWTSMGEMSGRMAS